MNFIGSDYETVFASNQKTDKKPGGFWWANESPVSGAKLHSFKVGAKLHVLCNFAPCQIAPCPQKVQL